MLDTPDLRHRTVFTLFPADVLERSFSRYAEELESPLKTIAL